LGSHQTGRGGTKRVVRSGGGIREVGGVGDFSKEKKENGKGWGMLRGGCL